MSHYLRQTVIATAVLFLVSCEPKGIRNAAAHYVRTEYGEVKDLHLTIGEGDAATAYVDAVFITSNDTPVKITLLVEREGSWRVIKEVSK